MHLQRSDGVTVHSQLAAAGVVEQENENGANAGDAEVEISIFDTNVALEERDIHEVDTLDVVAITMDLSAELAAFYQRIANSVRRLKNISQRKVLVLRARWENKIV